MSYSNTLHFDTIQEAYLYTISHPVTNGHVRIWNTTLRGVFLTEQAL